MPAPKTFHGGRGRIYITDPNDGSTKLVGIFNSASYGLTFDVQPVYILGRMGPAELVYTGQEAVSLQCSGFRVVGAGAHVAGRLPNTRDLLTSEYLTIVINDRQTGRDVATFHSVRAASYQTTLNARALEEISVSYTALLVDDEDTQLSERADANDLP
jgi:hypothetical protein